MSSHLTIRQVFNFLGFKNIENHENINSKVLTIFDYFSREILCNLKCKESFDNIFFKCLLTPDKISSILVLENIGSWRFLLKILRIWGRIHLVKIESLAFLWICIPVLHLHHTKSYQSITKTTDNQLLSFFFSYSLASVPFYCWNWFLSLE